MFNNGILIKTSVFKMIRHSSDSLWTDIIFSIRLIAMLGSVHYLTICLTATLASSDNVPQPGRAFSLFDYIPFISNDRYGASPPLVMGRHLPMDEYNKRFHAMMLRMSMMSQQMNTLQSEIDASKIKTPSTDCLASSPPGAVAINGACYVLYTKLTLDPGEVYIRCIYSGGSIASPLAKDAASLYNSLKISFPDQMTAIGANGIWIGLQRETQNSANVPFTYLTNPEFIVSNDIFTSVPTHAGGQEFAYLNTPPNSADKPFTVVSLSDENNLPRGMLCQY